MAKYAVVAEATEVNEDMMSRVSGFLCLYITTMIGSLLPFFVPLLPWCCLVRRF